MRLLRTLTIAVLLLTSVQILGLNKETPSARFFKEHNMTKIQKFYSQNWYSTDTYNNSLPLFIKAIDNEKKPGFFGYHASTQRFRIFQDVIKSVVEEVFQYPTPQDFTFLRIPGDPMFELSNGKEDFYKMFDRNNDDPKIQNLLIGYFLLTPLKEKLGVTINLEDLSSEDRTLIMEVFENLANKLNALGVGVKGIPFKGIAQHHKVNQIREDLYRKIQGTNNETYKKEVIDSLIKIRYGPNTKLLAKTGNPFPLYSPKKNAAKISTLFERILKAKQEHFTSTSLTKWLENTFVIKNILNKYFQAHYSTLNKIASYIYPFWDTESQTQARLVALNLPLFGNYYRFDESTVEVFLANSTVEDGDHKTTHLLRKWFDQIGLDPELVHELIKVAKDEIKTAKVKGGCLFQFFDLSETPYQLSDNSAYVSYPFGIPEKGIEPSELVKGEKPLEYIDSDYPTLHRQLRLITSNQITLNPFSYLRIIRYDNGGDELSNRIIAKMRVKLAKASINKNKQATYKAKLERCWDLLEN